MHQFQPLATASHESLLDHAEDIVGHIASTAYTLELITPCLPLYFSFSQKKWEQTGHAIEGYNHTHIGRGNPPSQLHGRCC